MDNRVWDTFYTTPLMPTYLVAFIVSELQKIPTSNPMINLYVRPEVVPQASFAAEITPKILDELQKFTGVPYAMRKLDLVGIPDFYFGAMENWGLCTFRYRAARRGALCALFRFPHALYFLASRMIATHLTTL